MGRQALSAAEIEGFRERLVEVATHLFARRGYEGVTLRAISEELGCSPMTPYRYFRGKDEIFAAVRSAAYNDFAATQEAARATSPDPTAQLTALGRAYIRFALERPDAYRLMFELGQPDPDGYPELRDAELRAWAPLRGGVGAAVAAGALAGDPDEIAHVFWGGPCSARSPRAIADLERTKRSNQVMSKPETDWDVIVIGAGLGGLSAAARLSKAGLRVLVLEQHVYSGGYAHHFLRKVRGTKIVYDFDVALHQTGDLTPGRDMHRLLGDLGVLEQIGLNRFDVAYRSRGPRHDLQVPADASPSCSTSTSGTSASRPSSRRSGATSGSYRRRSPHSSTPGCGRASTTEAASTSRAAGRRCPMPSCA
jgi:AcrR family transcriptional regulator